MLPKFITTAAVALVATLASAQTFTDCDPTKKDCPNPKAVGSKIIDVDFRKGANSFFNVLEGTKLTYDDKQGAIFTINKETDAPTISSGNKYIFFGRVDVTVKVAPGAGVVTSFVLQSDDLDEIDWEWLGGDAAQVQTNYFSKGCTQVYDRGGFSPVGNPQDNFITYTINWTPEKLEWIINGAVVRTLLAANAKGCSGYPQTPMQIKLGTWVAGRKDAPQGTIDWAGGLTNFANAPFNAAYQEIKIQDYMGGQGATEATEYQYSDRSGTWQSIKVVNNGVEAPSNGGSTKGTSTTVAPTTSSKGSSAQITSSTVTSASSGSAATTLSTVTSATTAASATTTNAAANVPNNGANAPASGTATTSTSPAAPTSAAGKVTFTFGNVAAMGATLLFGSLAVF
ncbi:glycoside hydrolase family 16 protein [Podospora didyma]|uniref:Crh-like protein n=1 Tax=Podospora didyma TaxID=330526 RepID=A0AAE0NHG7_9PEZI|nr:glycoside hydrolase family 16 protein [Podospora didyma]